MDKRLKIAILIIINIIIVIFLFLLLDFIAFKNLNFSNTYNFLNKKNFELNTFIESSPFRKPIGTKYNNKSIIVAGCSYAYGAGVKENETFAANISVLLKRPVYNIGTPGVSIQHSLVYVQSGKLDEIIKKSDYFIYIFIGDHFMRTIGDDPFDGPASYPVFIKKKNKEQLYLKNSILPILEYSYFVYYIKNSIYRRLLISENEKFEYYLFDLVKLHFLDLNKELKRINPSIKLVVIVYHDKDIYETLLQSERWGEFENTDIKIIDVLNNLPEIFNNKNNKIDPMISKCYTSEEYCVLYDGHPNAAAWEKVAKKVIDILGLSK